MKKILITGSSGLVGSEAVLYFDRLDYQVYGLDNNMRKEFFGIEGDTSSTKKFLINKTNYIDLYFDIRNREKVLNLFREHRFEAIIHCAAQPSHDKAKEIPLIDFDVNAIGTVNLLEAAKRNCPEAPFIFMSTNKVYGDAPNEIPVFEYEKRYDYFFNSDGVSENCRIDQTMHSLFGASKTAADVMAQEYGRYFDLPVGVFRGGCITGERHAAVQLHGFLAFLIKNAKEQKKFTIFGYKGKQVRDQIHAYDLVTAFHEFIKNPKYGEVNNIGGGKQNSASILECIDLIEQLTGYRLEYEYVDLPRKGDHICYYSNLNKFKTHYPNWNITKNLNSILQGMISITNG